MNDEVKNEENTKKKQKRKVSPSLTLNIVFILGVALIIFLAEFLISTLRTVLVYTEVMTSEQAQTDVGIVVVWVFAATILGLLIAWGISAWLLKPIKRLMDGLNMLAGGDYSVRLVERKSGTIRSVAKNFNHMAEELGKTEMLRSDFINSFSHEFKTPISSINGLIAIMKQGKLSRQKQNEYLDIIAEETNRLSEMTTNILNLTKYENQGELTDKTTFNLSEQIRMCVLLLERKWSAKNLNLSLDFDEYEISGNDDMLRQVWVNLMDNAIKFSPQGGTLTVRVSANEDTVTVDVENTGSEIKQEDLTRIFQRFYRADATHEKEGNGIGLSIVGSIVKLHGGTVSAKSENKVTTFTVALPVK